MDQRMNPDEKSLLVYTTIGSLVDAEKLGDDLVSMELAACVNIIPSIMSVYQSKGKIVHDHEAIMIIKSRENLKTRLLDGLKRLHPYELPAIFVIIPEECDSDFLEWIQIHTSKKGRGVN